MSSRCKVDPSQLDFLDLLTRVRDAESFLATPVLEGSFDISARLRAAVTQTLKECPKSRWEVVGLMSELLGQDVSKYMLDCWTAEGKRQHRFPLEFLPAFVKATENATVLGFVAEASGYHCIGEGVL